MVRQAYRAAIFVIGSAHADRPRLPDDSPCLAKSVRKMNSTVKLCNMVGDAKVEKECIDKARYDRASADHVV
jgi:hypothetical protein